MKQLETDSSFFCLHAIVLFVLPFLTACGVQPDDREHAFDIRAPTPASETGINDRRLLASGIKFQAQSDGGILHRVTASTVSIAPRGFAAFTVNGFNELLVENVVIDDFKKNLSGSNGDNEDNNDLTDALQSYAESLEAVYGIVSRIHMCNVQITLHGAGKNDSNVNVFAKELTKDFGKGNKPELHGLAFYDGQSENVLKVAHATWDTEARRFIIDSSMGR